MDYQIAKRTLAYVCTRAFKDVGTV